MPLRRPPGQGQGQGAQPHRHHHGEGRLPAQLNAPQSDPSSFYANLHTAEFPGGAVRGRLHKVTVTEFDFREALRDFQAPVVEGKQIYQCKPAEGGGYAFARRDVSAVLGGRIARDGSAGTGAIVSRTPSGDGNVPELDLKATVGGVAPAGSCAPGAILGVPYQADYVSING
ncbi:CHRD domain-containing protein [Streptomyces sp. NPDC057623]|uniref:CHRD domain-containing protein n=1 Tax=Streptomyces sp. NPDC057623 TaxID=3346187 RepID=UPI00367A99EB